MQHIFEKNIKEINEEDLHYLLEYEVIEDRQLEYKGTLEPNSDRWKGKFLKVTSSFANTSGGLLICGINEENGVPRDFNLLNIDDFDSLRIILQDIIRSRSEPIIPNLEIEKVEINGEDKHILLIKVGKSWNGPHRVKLNGKREFFVRIDGKSTPMDIFELRNAFNLSETLIDKIKTFKQNRISEILTNSTPLPLEKGAKFILHIVPLNSFSINRYNATVSLSTISQFLIPICSSIHSIMDRKYTLEGYLKYERPEENKTNSYVHLYRNGILEAVSTNILDNGNKRITRTFHEKELVKSVNNYLKLYNQLNVEWPIFIFLTIINVKGFTMEREEGYRGSGTDDYPISEDILNIPELFIEKEESDIKTMLKPLFDSIYNACGYEGSINYSESE